jgi:hypothetical protein
MLTADEKDRFLELLTRTGIGLGALSNCLKDEQMTLRELSIEQNVESLYLGKIRGYQNSLNCYKKLLSKATKIILKNKSS